MDREINLFTLRSTTLSDNKGLKDLQKEIVALTATLKSATFQGAKPKKAGTTGEKRSSER